MVTMVTHRLMDNLSCMLLAKDEFQANRQACGDGANMQAQLDSELARENALLRQHLLEAAADNNAISKSLQERVQSLADTTDAKIRAETEAKMLQVQGKSLQKDLDCHKYELHLLRKQLQIRNEEREHHKKASDASYQKHLENVKKIARLESECQRLRGLIRQRLPGPAAIAQMRAECDIHVKMGIKKKSLSVVPYTTPNKSALHNSSSLQAQREIEGLKERLLSVEDEAKFLKEAMTKRTTELQDARQLCARTAMKLSAAQSLVESMTSETNTVYSTPSTPTYLQSGVPLFESDRLHDLPNEDLIMLKPDCVIGENNAVHASSTMHGDVDDGILDVNSELKSTAGHNNNGELDEVSCAESWASALFAELSHLSSLHEDTSATSCGSIVNQENQIDETSKFKTDNVILNANMEELDVNSALEMVHQRLSSVGETLLTSFKAKANSSNMEEEIDDSESLCDMRHNDTNSSARNDGNHEILEEILQIKELLMNIDGAMEMGNGSTKKYTYGYMNGDELAYDRELIVKQAEGQKLALIKGERGLSRLRYNSLEDEGDAVSAKSGEEGDEIALLGTKFSEKTDEMEDMCTKFSEQADVIEAHLGTTYGEKTDMGSAMITSEEIANSNDLGGENPTKFSEDFHISNTAATAIGQLNCSRDAANGQLSLVALAAGEESDVASALDADLELERLLHAAQAELDLARDRIATLEAELARCLQEKADVATELSDTRSLKQSLEGELACAVASMEDLKLQLSTLQADQAPHGNLFPFQGGPPTLAHIDVHPSVKEEEELAAARAQLADCQRSIHVIRKQIASEMQHSSQDVINDDQVPFDSSSESSKSVDQSSHLPSPIPDTLSCFIMPSSNTIITKPTEDIVTQQGCNTPYCPTSSKSHALQEDGNSPPFEVSDGHATEQQTQQNLQQCKNHDADIKTKAFMYLNRSSSKNRASKPPQNLSKLPKSSTASRISEFFSRAKSSIRGSEI